MHEAMVEMSLPRQELIAKQEAWPKQESTNSFAELLQRSMTADQDLGAIQGKQSKQNSTEGQNLINQFAEWLEEGLSIVPSAEQPAEAEKNEYSITSGDLRAMFSALFQIISLEERDELVLDEQIEQLYQEWLQEPAQAMDASKALPQKEQMSVLLTALAMLETEQEKESIRMSESVLIQLQEIGIPAFSGVSKEVSWLSEQQKKQAMHAVGNPPNGVEDDEPRMKPSEQPVRTNSPLPAVELERFLLPVNKQGVLLQENRWVPLARQEESVSSSDEAERQQMISLKEAGQLFALRATQSEQAVIHVNEQQSLQERQQQFLRQFQYIIGRQASGLQAAGTTGTTLALTLHPEHLGRLDIQLIHREGVMVAKIAAGSQMTRELLESQLHQLRTVFLQQQLPVERIEILEKEVFNDSKEQLGSDRDENQDTMHDEQEQDETEQENAFDEMLKAFTFNEQV